MKNMEITMEFPRFEEGLHYVFLLDVINALKKLKKKYHKEDEIYPMTGDFTEEEIEILKEIEGVKVCKMVKTGGTNTYRCEIQVW